MAEGQPIIYMSKRCEHCLTLIEVLRKRDDLSGNYRIVMIDDEPFPNYVKSVPCMVSGQELFSASDIFMMLEESNDDSPQQAQPQENSQCSTEKECSVDGYCPGGSCLAFSSLDGDDTGSSLDSFYNEVSQGGVQKTNGGDDIRKIKTNKMDSDYERLLQERGELQPMNTTQDIMRR